MDEKQTTELHACCQQSEHHIKTASSSSPALWTAEARGVPASMGLCPPLLGWLPAAAAAAASAAAAAISSVRRFIGEDPCRGGTRGSSGRRNSGARLLDRANLTLEQCGCCGEVPSIRCGGGRRPAGGLALPHFWVACWAAAHAPARVSPAGMTSSPPAALWLSACMCERGGDGRAVTETCRGGGRRDGVLLTKLPCRHACKQADPSLQANQIKCPLPMGGNPPVARGGRRGHRHAAGKGCGGAGLGLVLTREEILLQRRGCSCACQCRVCGWRGSKTSCARVHASAQ